VGLELRRRAEASLFAASTTDPIELLGTHDASPRRGDDGYTFGTDVVNAKPCEDENGI
jgi:hypothetical protein